MMNADVSVFADKVRAAYIEEFGDDPFRGTDADSTNPFAIGAILVAFETHLVDDDDRVVTVVFDGSATTALGLATWAQAHLLDDLRNG